jgi:serine/threonine-protein kinase
VTDNIARLTTALGDRYRVERELGAGGMATVYLAHDIKHDRRVAVKVLRPELAAVIGAERFLREIKTIANLQHPHILGLIDSGELDGTAYYVMPFVDGESLRDRITRDKQLPIAEAVRLTSEVAAALDYAHRHGVVHRDIKPENILLQDGSALVADFGIALAASTAGTRMTETGMSLGTPQYMSPEQAMGEREITPRSDVYALGCVTYEMLIGEPPFSGATAQAIVARIITEKPRSLIAQRHTVPPHVEAAVLTAIEKLPADRFASAGEFAAAIANRSYTSTTTMAAPVAPPSRRLRDPWFVAVALVAVAALAGLAVVMRPKPVIPALTTIRYIMAATDSTQPAGSFPWPAAISPDGGSIVYSVGMTTPAATLYLLHTDQLVPHQIPGTAGGYQPYFSPDGQWLAFEANGKERKVRLDGSAPIAIADANGANGGTWTAGNEIILGNQGAFTGLSRVSAAGGNPVALTHVDSAHGEHDHLWPVALADGKTVAFTSWSGSLATAQLALASLSDGAVTRLHVAGIRPLAMLDGMLVYLQADGVVMAVGVDLAGKRTVGTPIPVHDPVAVAPGFNGNSDVFISTGGAMVTATGSANGTLSWIAADGRITAISPHVQAYTAAKLAPDEQRIATLQATGDQHDIWIYDLRLGTSSRLTTSGKVNSVEWAPDGTHLVYTAANDSGSAIWRQLAAGGTAPERLAELPYPVVDAVLSPDGKALLATALPHDDWNTFRIALDSPAVSRAYLVTHSNQHAPRFSPDGKWVALSDDESGQDEVYIRSYPDPTIKVQISSGGGAEPTWSSDGTRLFYTAGSVLFSAQLSMKSGLTLVGRDTVQANVPVNGTLYGYFSANYQVPRDGKRIVAIAPDRNSFQLVISPNWITEFRKRVAESSAHH